MLRTRALEVSLWEAVLPEEVLRLPEELAQVDVLLDDPVFFAPRSAPRDQHGVLHLRRTLNPPPGWRVNRRSPLLALPGAHRPARRPNRHTGANHPVLRARRAPPGPTPH